MGYDGKIFAMELGKSCDCQIHLLPPLNCLLTLSSLSRTHVIANKTIASESMHHKTLHGNFINVPHSELDVGSDNEIDQQSGHIVAEQSEGLAQITRMLIDRRLRIVPVTYVRAEIVVTHKYGEEFPVTLHIHMWITLQQIDEHTGLIKEIA